MVAGGSDDADRSTPRPSAGILAALRNLPPPPSLPGLGALPVGKRARSWGGDKTASPKPAAKTPRPQSDSKTTATDRATAKNKADPAPAQAALECTPPIAKKPSSPKRTPLERSLSANLQPTTSASLKAPSTSPDRTAKEPTTSANLEAPSTSPDRTAKEPTTGANLEAPSTSPDRTAKKPTTGASLEAPSTSPDRTAKESTVSANLGLTQHTPPIANRERTPPIDAAPQSANNEFDTGPQPTSSNARALPNARVLGLRSGIPRVIDQSLEATPPVAIRGLDPLVPAASPVPVAQIPATQPTRASERAESASVTARGDPLGLENEQVPAQIGRFTVLKLLGSGGMGEVYAAYDPDLDRRVALKVLHAQVSQSSSSSTARARLLREAKALAKLSHPNVVAIYDVGTVNEQIFIAMEFVKGMTLTKWMRQPPEPLADGTESKFRAWSDILALFLQAGRGLAAAHKAGIIHRDFKPDNVLLGRDGRIRVVDFGLARADGGHAERPDTFADAIKSLSNHTSSVFELRLTRTGGMAGTPAYMAPEQYLNLQVDARTDQFSYCVALYEGLYGERPFRGDTIARVRKAVINGEIVDAPKESEVPHWLRNILLRGLSVHPGARYPSMDALLAELSDDPGRPQQSWLKASMVLSVGLMIATFSFFQLRDQDNGHLLDVSSCQTAAAPLAEAYGPERERELEQRFANSGIADANQTWRRVDDLLDEMTADLSHTFSSVCLLDQLRGDSRNDFVERQGACLERRIGPLKALTEGLGELPAAAQGHAVVAAYALLSLTPCSDPSSLHVRVETSDDPKLADLSARLRADLDRARATSWLGRPEEALTITRQVSTEAGHIDNFAVRAEAYLLQGELEEQRGDYEGAERSLKEALWHAEASRHDEVAIDSLTHLVRVLGVDLQRHDDADTLTPRLTAAVRRLGDKRRDARAQLSLGLAESARGHTDAAIVRLEAAAKTAESISGSYGRLLGASIHIELGRALVLAKRLDQALKHHRRAVDTLESALGTNNPAVARGNLALCETWAAKGDLTRAIRTCRRAVELCREASVPGYRRAEARFALARIIYQARRSDEAIATARQSLDEIAGNPAGLALSRQINKWLQEHVR